MTYFPSLMDSELPGGKALYKGELEGVDRTDAVSKELKTFLTIGLIQSHATGYLDILIDKREQYMELSHQRSIYRDLC